MAGSQARYTDVREAYFSSSKPPPIPPKEERRVSCGSQNGLRFSSPNSSPRHSGHYPSPISNPAHSTGSPVHYTEYSHSVPRSRSKHRAPQTSSALQSRGVLSGLALSGANLIRSSSFSSSGNVKSPSNMVSPSNEAPPAIPPRPVFVPSVQKILKRKKPKFLTDDMSFDYFIRHHQKSFPLRIYITNGYLGATSRLTISTGDMYNIHFVKHTRVMLFRDHHDTPYSIPLNSAIEFGLLYEPKEGRRPTDLEMGMVFPSIADLVSQPETPKVVTALKTWQSKDGKVSVLTNEVLVIKSVQRSVFTKKGVRVHSLTTKSDKFLSEDCSTQFSTQPALCRLHITDIVEHLKSPKGARCVLFLNSQVFLNRELSSAMQEIPDELFQKVLTIVDQITETSLIASSMLRRDQVSGADFDPDRDVLFDIPVDENTAEMTCCAVEIADSKETEKLYDDTKSLYEKFDPSKVLSVKDTGSEDAHVAQKLLYTTIRRGCEGVGVELDRPEAVYDSVRSRQRLEQQLPTPPSSTSSSPSPSLKVSHPPRSRTASPRLPRAHPDADQGNQGELEDSYDEVTPESLQLMHQQPLPSNQPSGALATVVKRNTSGQPLPPPTDTIPQLPTMSGVVPVLESRVAGLEQQVWQSQRQVAGLQSSLEQSGARVAGLESEVGRMKSTVEKLLPQIYALQSRLSHLTTSPQRQSAGNGPPASELGREEEGKGAMVEKNKKELSTLTSQEICELLDAMDLGQYKDTFSRECVSGEILLECDDDILRNELGVVSRLHRLRLSKIIDGRHSATNVIEGADPYVTLGTT